ncbi:MAG: VWA domain-containing protein [Abditibacteriales bacterium]|nr:VWA domain-containing protein [Abditibacteriales bacterium]MDW8364764.1 vWA domain-containing protein [Abditibacteriales bacterium]
MNDDIQLAWSFNRPWVSSREPEEQPVYAVVRLTPNPALTQQSVNVNLALVLDTSGSMHNFQLTDEQKRYWLAIAEARGEVSVGYADGQVTRFWRGQTLQEIQRIARKPITLAAEAIRGLMARLSPGDTVSLTAFATGAELLFPKPFSFEGPAEMESALQQMESGQLIPTLGSGTRMAGAIELAREQLQRSGPLNAVKRMIVVSDGMVEDREETLNNFERVKDDNIRVTTIGVGDAFDEEFLTKVADNCQGEYHYLTHADQIAQTLAEEFAVLKATVVRNIEVAFAARNDATLVDVHQCLPSFRTIEEMWVEGDWTRVRVGDLSVGQSIGLILEIAPATLREGEHTVITVRVGWDPCGPTAAFSPQRNEMERSLKLIYTREQQLLETKNHEVEDLIDRFFVYRAEREAARAQQRGDLATASERLRHATRILRRLGEPQLAREFETQAAALESNAALDPSRVKGLKAKTRRLGQRQTA